MQCPLCGGPLHVDGDGQFTCERSHQLSPDQLQTASGTRVTTALWMAIEALESEADGLRTLATFGRGDGTSDLAEQAEKDAQLLRDLAGKHVPPGHTVQEATDGA